MQQDAHLARLRGGAAIPLTLLAQRAGTTTADACSIDDAQAPISFSAPLVCHKCLPGRAAERSIRLERKVLPREATSLPGESHSRQSISLCGSLRVDLLCARRRDGRSKFRRAHGVRIKLMAQFETQVPEPLGDDLPALLACCRMASPAVWVLFLVFISQRRFKGTTMQIQRHDITSRERALGELCHKQFVDHTQT